MPKEISVHELKKKMDDGETFTLVDCREEDEHRYCRIEGAVLIPISQFDAEATTRLKKDETILIYCHLGGRSYQACCYLEEHGYENVFNVNGGIEEWSLAVDQKVPRY